MNKLLIHMMNAGDIDHRILPGLQKMQKGGTGKVLPKQSVDPRVFPKETLENRQKVYRTVRPTDYTDIKNYARYFFNNDRDEWDDERSEEAFKIYLGLQPKPEYFRPSKYKPTINADPNGYYYSADEQLEQDIFNSFKDKVKPGQILPTDEYYVDSKFPGNPNAFWENGKQMVKLDPNDEDLIMGRPMASRARALGQFVVSRGSDKEGDYLSYADQYDFPEKLQNKMQGLPYKIYGRVYYPKDKPKKAYGGPILDPRGQWAHPGKVTRIPSSNITMEGVPYPVLGVASSGQQVMMQPGQNYNFGDAEYVDEYPMMKNGGGLLSKSVTCSNCGWSWKAVDGGSDPLSCHKCGGTVKMQAGGQPDYNSILDQNAADAEKYPSAYHKDFVTGYPVANSAGSIPRPGGFDCPPGYTKYRNPDGTFSCIMTNSAPGSSKVDFSRMTKVADDMQFSRPMRPPLASIPIRKNGGLINMQGGGQSTIDSVRHQANKILQYEQLRGGPGGAPLPQYSNPKYMDMLMGKVYPEVRKIMPNASAMEAGEAMDFVFNAGFDQGTNKITKDPRAFALQEYYRQNDPSKLDADGKWAGRKNAPYSFDQEYNNTIGKLPENQRRILMNKGRDWYYKNINNPAPGVPNSNYNDTWFGRIWNTNDYQPFNPNNPNFTPKKEQGGEASLWDMIKMAQGGEMIRRADGSYSRRGLWDNIRANKGSGKKPTKQMLEQERKIKSKNK